MEAAHDEAEIAFRQQAAFVGAAVEDGDALLGEHGLRNGPAAAPVPARNAAHGTVSEPQERPT